ncbi:MAG TPA: hypothetical protein VEL11_17735 [Candidatus Bathyarchaeia archaeon]|nr:hypothetical protein [Candidatus Bathyarchaeia archaeon]
MNGATATLRFLVAFQDCPTGDAVFKTIEESIPPSPIIDTSITKSILKNHLEKYLSEIE